MTLLKIGKWNDPNFSGEAKVDTYVRPAVTTFRDIQHFRLTHGYGELREGAADLKSAVATLCSPMRASFIVHPQSKRLENGLYTEYIAFVQCTSEHLLRTVYETNTRGAFCWEQRIPDEQPTGWRYRILPPLPKTKYDYPGNLVVLLKRRNDDELAVDTSNVPSGDMKTIDSIWMFPEVTGLAARRKVNCANIIAEQKGQGADEMRRYVQALDLSEPVKPGLFAKLTPEEERMIQPIVDEMAPSQIGAWHHIRTTRHPIVFIQGPPGTGKTTFGIKFVRICKALGIPVNVHGPSNVSVDVFIGDAEKDDPQLGALRYHSYDNETRAMRKLEQDYDDDNNGGSGDARREEAKTEETQEQIKDAEERQGFAQFYTECANLDSEWKQMNNKRPRWDDCSLHARALQNAGIVKHDIECYKSTQDKNPHAAFVQASRGEHWARDSSEEEVLAYKTAEKALMQDTLRKAWVVGTTLSNAADSNSKNGRKPRVILVDECCQATELEALLVYAHNSETVVLIIFIGDPRQLPPTILTHNQNWQGTLVNAFAPQLRWTYFERLHRRGFYVYRLNTNFRLVEPLTDPWNPLWYDGTLVTHPSAKLAKRPHAQAGIAFVKKHFGVSSPVILLDVSGVCLSAGPRSSRLNLHNIVVVIHYIKKILACGLWKEEDMTIITPYWEQTRRYHEVLRALGLYGITVRNIDSMQGREGRFIFLDMTTASLREAKSLGFLIEPERLNVALSRPQEMMMIISDTDATAELLINEDDERQAQRAMINREREKHLRAVHDHYMSLNLARNVNPTGFKEWELVDKTLITEFEAKRAKKCHNCGRIGQFKNDCQEPLQPRKKKLPFTLPGKGAPADIENIEEDKIATRAEAQVEQLEMPKDWAEMTVDPKADYMSDEEETGPPEFQEPDDILEGMLKIKNIERMRVDRRMSEGMEMLTDSIK
ncbi:MAG: hypothetical protein Q9178_005451 [Gyalolechia marmorata]